MTHAQQKKRLARIIRGWVRQLYMDHIVIDVEWGENPEDPDALASIYPHELYDHAIMRFREDWTEHDLDTLNRIVVHELLHVMFRDYGRAARSIAVTGAISTDVRILWHDRCNDAEEALVDRLANRLVDLGGVIE